MIKTYTCLSQEAAVALMLRDSEHGYYDMDGCRWVCGLCGQEQRPIAGQPGPNHAGQPRYVT